MLLPAIFSLLASDGNGTSFGFPALGAMILGTILFYLTRNPGSYILRQDVFLIVVLGWLGVATIGALPFFISGLMGPVDAFFESMAGFTTTGASTIRIPEEVAPSLLLWRSMTQWAGGIGIVLLFVAVAPLLGVGAARLLGAEMSGLTQPRLTPRIADTAKALVVIYLAISVAETACLLVAGMPLYDAVIHTFGTVATGGFSSKTASVGFYDSIAIEAIIAVFLT